MSVNPGLIQETNGRGNEEHHVWGNRQEGGQDIDNIQADAQEWGERSQMSMKSKASIPTLALSVGLLISTVWIISSPETSAQSLATVDRSSITAIDEVDHLPAPSWKAIPLSLPYDASVAIAIQVVRGNPIDVLLMLPSQFGRVKRGEWSKIKVAGGVREIHTRSFTHHGPLSRGGYYLVIGDRYLGEPAALPSEVSVKVQIDHRLP